MIHMGLDPSHDDLWALFLSYASLSMLYGEGGSTPHDGSGDAPEALLPRLLHASRMIATLMAHGHLLTTDDLMFVGMVEGGGDLIFETLCSD